MEKLEEKIDTIAADVAYMRGRVDEALPTLQQESKEHAKSIAILRIKHENIKTKVGLAGTVSGFIGGAIIEWGIRHFHL